ncbi:MAG: RNA polymerase sigma factor SigJ [Actinomycetales bacterium]
MTTVIGERRRLINLAYRFLGSLAEAEDAVQEAYARWYAMDEERQAQIETPAAWLTTVTSRICLDLLNSARARRERYVGEWLPEPLPEPTEWMDAHPGATAADPADRVTLDESVSMAFLVVLDSMTPAERVAFILHDVFRYPFADVAEITGRSAAAARQLASSARRRIDEAQSTPAPAARQAAIVREFKHAWETKDIKAIVDLLDPDAIVVADGGGLVPAALEPIVGREAIAHFAELVTTHRPTGTMLERTVNGQPGLVVKQGDLGLTVMAFELAGDRIKRIYIVRNPEKLRPWTGNAQS